MLMLNVAGLKTVIPNPVVAVAVRIHSGEALFEGIGLEIPNAVLSDRRADKREHQRSSQKHQKPSLHFVFSLFTFFARTRQRSGSG